jgi:YihY family inner membrane protein
VSTATVVPETWQLHSDDARKTIERTGRKQLLSDSVRRLRAADGFSHARSLAFMTALVLVQGLIAVVGLASAMGTTRLAGVVVDTVHSVVPGPAGDVLTTAVKQAQQNGFAHRYLALVVGLIGTLVSATTAMGQMERALNRIYGVEQDRPAMHKYARALGLAVSAGTLTVVSFIVLANGRAIGQTLDNDTLSTVWNLCRWPVATVMITAAVTMLFKYSPRRRQPALSWLAYGASISVFGWLLVTVALSAFFRLSSSFGDTYGPLAGVVGLLVWGYLSAVAVLLGAAVAAQLEAVRAGCPFPIDEEKVVESAPSARDNAVPAAAGSR